VSVMRLCSRSYGGYVCGAVIEADQGAALITLGATIVFFRPPANHPDHTSDLAEL
jgi:CO/xanthine dehydrogenase FAD-binding subunit